MEDYYEKRDKEKDKERDTNVVIKPLEDQCTEALKVSVTPGEINMPFKSVSTTNESNINRCEVAKSPALTDILNDLQNVREPIDDGTIEDTIDTTSPNKRASARAKAVKEREEMLRLYEENSKACDEVMNELLKDIDKVDKSKATSNDMATSTETVWIRTKNKAKVIVPTNASEDNIRRHSSYCDELETATAITDHPEESEVIMKIDPIVIVPTIEINEDKKPEPSLEEMGEKPSSNIVANKGESAEQGPGWGFNDPFQPSQ